MTEVLLFGIVWGVIIICYFPLQFYAFEQVKWLKKIDSYDQLLSSVYNQVK